MTGDEVRRAPRDMLFELPTVQEALAGARAQLRRYQLSAMAYSCDVASHLLPNLCLAHSSALIR